MINLQGEKAKTRYLAQTIRASLVFERQMEQRGVKLLDSQARMAAQIYRTTGSQDEVMVAVERGSVKWEDLIQKQHLRVGEYFGGKMLRAMKHGMDLPLELKDIDRWRLIMRNFIQVHAAKQVVNIQNTTKGLIRRAIRAAADSGLGNYGIAKEIYGKISGIGKLTAKVRCRLIARTESHTAANHSTNVAAKIVPFHMLKDWISAEDERTRPSHFNLGAAAPIEMDERFAADRCDLEYPGDPTALVEEIANCRCTVNYITDATPKKAIILMPEAISTLFE